MKSVLLAAVAVLISTPGSAHGRIHIGVAVSAWASRATDVVIATEELGLSGRLIVIETLKGRLEPGDVLYIPELAPDRLSKRTVPCDFIPGRDSECGNVRITGLRMVLFLSRAPISKGGQTENRIVWTGAGGGPVSWTTVWIEHGCAIAHEGGDVLGFSPGALIVFASSERSVREAIERSLNEDVQTRRGVK